MICQFIRLLSYRSITSQDRMTARGREAEREREGQGMTENMHDRGLVAYIVVIA